MATKIAAVRTLKVGRHIIIDGEPCKIVSYQTAKTGKHGSAKARIEAMGILDNKRRSLVKPVDAKIEVPMIERKSAQINYKTGNTLGLMDLETYETFDVSIPTDVEGEFIEGGEVEYIEAMGRKKIVRVR
ncbi:MAG: translation initiation factor IF-5A [Candidatus Hydrothermarchaeales archaeon]